MEEEYRNIILKSQQFSIIAICMNCLNTISPPDHYHNCFIATGTLGQIHVQLLVTGVKELKECSSYYWRN